MTILEFTNRNLFVNIEEFKVKINQGHGQYTGGTQYYSDGRFTIDTLNNSYKDIFDCLSYPIDKPPKINLFDKYYELTITSISSEFIENDYGIYSCNFIAIPATNSSKQNNILNSANTEFNINDLNEIIGDDAQLIEQKVIKLIDLYSDYIPTKECPTPSTAENASKADDLAAVLANRKPAVIIDELHLSNPMITLMCLEANTIGLTVDTVSNFSKTKSLVIGSKHNVKQIIETMTMAISAGEMNDFLYRRLAKLTGYPNEALSTPPTKDFGFNTIQ